MRRGFGFPMMPPQARSMGASDDWCGGPRVILIAVPKEVPAYPVAPWLTGMGPGFASVYDIGPMEVDSLLPPLPERRIPAVHVPERETWPKSYGQPSELRGEREPASDLQEEQEEEEDQEDGVRSERHPQFRGRRMRRRCAAGVWGAGRAPAKPRALFPGPGLWRVLPYGEFQGALAGQLAHPARLAETHQIPCYVQVYDAPDSSPVGIARAVLGSESRARELFPLTAELEDRLQLTSQLAPADWDRGERYVRVQPVHDPTALTPARTAPAPVTPPSEKKSKIPERYLKPWEFRYSREEVLYDMNQLTERPGIFSGIAHWARKRLQNRAAFRKWQALLQGKAPDEQLWGVRPPEGALRDERVREWVSQLLALDGYDPTSMLIEWEIFWRRKRL